MKKFFQFDVTNEQLEYTEQLVDYSIKYHPVKDIYEYDPNGKINQRDYRITGTLGEVCFADAYGLERPKKSFGAVNGQDYGQDFVLKYKGKSLSIDVKTMRRENNYFREDYVLNLPKYQMEKNSTITDYYFNISLHQENNKFVASFIGFVSKKMVLSGRIGTLYYANTKRTKDNGKSFIFKRDTYEVEFKDIYKPIINDSIMNLEGFDVKEILPSIKKHTPYSI